MPAEKQLKAVLERERQRVRQERMREVRCNPHHQAYFHHHSARCVQREAATARERTLLQRIQRRIYEAEQTHSVIDKYYKLHKDVDSGSGGGNGNGALDDLQLASVAPSNSTAASRSYASVASAAPTSSTVASRSKRGSSAGAGAGHGQAQSRV